MTIVCVFDTETTGLIDNHSIKLDKQPEVIEFASAWADWESLATDAPRMIDEFSVLIKPRNPISEEITSRTAIDNDMVRDAPHFSSIFHQIYTLVSTADIICGHNLSFDMEILDLEFERMGQKIMWPAERICTVEQTAHIAQAAKRKGTGNRISLADLYFYLTGQEHEGAHRALVDVRATLRCLGELRKRKWL
jgi:DNA polymerase-3 subunit epsilon